MKAQIRTALAASLVAMTLSHGAAQDFPPIPENQWVFQTLSDFKKAGIPKEFPELVLRGTPSRFEVASAVLLIRDGLDQIFKGIETDMYQISKRPMPYPEWRREITPVYERVLRFQGYWEEMTALGRVIDLFEREIASLGHDAVEMKTRLWDLSIKNSEVLTRILDALDGPWKFLDVPEGHWVYDALEAGRIRGHFFGYPGDVFRGERQLTRYELAGTVNAFYQDVRGQIMDQLERVDYINRSGARPAAPLELTRAIAATNWVLQNRRGLKQFARGFAPRR